MFDSDPERPRGAGRAAAAEPVVRPDPVAAAVAAPPRAGILHRLADVAAGLGRLGPRGRVALQAAVVFLVFGSLVGFVLSQWGRLPDYTWRFEPGWLAVAAVTLGCVYLSHSEIWRSILGALGEHIDPTPARAVFAKSVLARYVPTNMLMLVGRIVMAERHGVQPRVCFASVVYEVGLAVCAAVIVGSYFLITLPQLQDEPIRYAILAVPPLGLAALHPRVFRPLADRLLARIGREPLPIALSARRVALYVALYALCFVGLGFAVFAFSSALRPMEAGDLPTVVASYSVAFGVAVLTFVAPGGLGTRDVALATALTAVMPATVATAIAVAFRLLQTAVELVWVGTVTAIARRATAPERAGTGRPPAPGS